MTITVTVPLVPYKTDYSNASELKQEHITSLQKQKAAICNELCKSDSKTSSVYFRVLELKGQSVTLELTNHLPTFAGAKKLLNDALTSPTANFYTSEFKLPPSKKEFQGGEYLPISTLLKQLSLRETELKGSAARPQSIDPGDDLIYEDSGAVTSWTNLNQSQAGNATLYSAVLNSTPAQAGAEGQVPGQNTARASEPETVVYADVINLKQQLQSSGDDEYINQSELEALHSPKAECSNLGENRPGGQPSTGYIADDDTLYSPVQKPTTGQPKTKQVTQPAQNTVSEQNENIYEEAITANKQQFDAINAPQAGSNRQSPLNKSNSQPTAQPAQSTANDKSTPRSLTPATATATAKPQRNPVSEQKSADNKYKPGAAASEKTQGQGNVKNLADKLLKSGFDPNALKPRTQ